MKKISIAFTALGLVSSIGAGAFADESTTKTETHTTDGKKTTKTTKVKRKDDGKGNDGVKSETKEKTEVSKPSGAGGEKQEKSTVHETDGKTTSSKKKVTHSADGKGNSEVKTETDKKTEVR